MLVEICASSFPSALHAQSGGAQRIELCTALSIGGLTPSPATMRAVREALIIEVCVLIRPREGDFCYTDAEFALLCEDIRFCRDIGMDGVVVGILSSDGELDTARMSQLVDMARPMDIVCHRAFDFVKDPAASLEQLIAMGYDRVLTSGQCESVVDGAELVASLVKQAAGRITVMPGSGIRVTNIKKLAEDTGATEFHLTAGSFAPSTFTYHGDLRLNGSTGIPEFDYYETLEDMVKRTVAELGKVGG